MEQMIAKAKELKAEQIKEWLEVNAYSEEYDDLVIQAMLCALQSKISEADFVAFCDSL